MNVLRKEVVPSCVGWHGQVLTRILTLSRLYLIDMGNEGRSQESNTPPPHPPGNLFLIGKSDESP